MSSSEGWFRSDAPGMAVDHFLHGGARMISVYTVLFDATRDLKKTPQYSQGLYRPEWVDKMYRMFKRNTTIPFQMFCITHYDQEAFAEPVQVIPFYEDDRSWLQLNEVYRPENITTERCMFVALDTVITGNIDHILAYEGDLGVVNCDGVFANPFTLYSRMTAKLLWQHWREDQKSHEAKYCIDKRPSELRWLEAEVTVLHKDLYNWHYLDSLFPGQMWSWPFSARDKHGVDWFPANTRIVYWHGCSKQHNCGASWVKDHWV